jgi:hypothetical protein
LSGSSSRYERGKGDRRHLGEREEDDYNFISLEQLMADFEHDVNEWSAP